jgi:hypothetical protein
MPPAPVHRLGVTPMRVFATVGRTASLETTSDEFIVHYSLGTWQRLHLDWIIAGHDISCLRVGLVTQYIACAIEQLPDIHAVLARI